MTWACLRVTPREKQHNNTHVKLPDFSFEGRREPWMVWNASTGMYVPEKEKPGNKRPELILVGLRV
jgi:hypothetical protein